MMREKTTQIVDWLIDEDAPHGPHDDSAPGDRLLYLLLGVALVLALSAAALCVHPAEASPGGPYTADDTLRAIDGMPYMVQCIVSRETGGTFNPYAVGALGEEGIAQILPASRGGGQWSAFYYGDWTPLDPSLRSTFNPYQSAEFLRQYGERYGYSAWSTARFC